MTAEALSPMPNEPEESESDLAVMLTGGGARAAYQVGLLRGISKHFPDLKFQVITGVSAGAINAIYLAAQEGTLRQKTSSLIDLWCELECRHIFRFDYKSMIPFRSALASFFPSKRWGRQHGLVDTSPLCDLMLRICGTTTGSQPIDAIRRNLEAGEIRSVALITLDYSTGQSVRWVQGRNHDVFEGPNRRSAATDLTVNHVMASAALPFIFPAISIGHEWHGDGGIRLAAPLSAAVHLGARRILAMSTGYQRTADEAKQQLVEGYPPAAQVLSQLVNAVFLDMIDEDVSRMERMNEMIRKMPLDDRNGFRPIDLCVLRPSVDLGKLAARYQKYLPLNLRMIMRALGANETESPDFVSLLMFEPHYTKELIALGEYDVESRLDELRTFFGNDAVSLTAVE